MKLLCYTEVIYSGLSVTTAEPLCTVYETAEHLKTIRKEWEHSVLNLLRHFWKTVNIGTAVMSLSRLFQFIMVNNMDLS